MWRWPFARAPLEPSRMVRGPDDFWERLALFSTAMARENATALFEGLSDASRSRAMAYGRELAALSSSDRQARIANEFGEREDAVATLRATLAEAGPGLRAEIVRLLPAHVRVQLDDVACPPARTASPLIAALAERLVREATR